MNQSLTFHKKIFALAVGVGLFVLPFSSASAMMMLPVLEHESSVETGSTTPILLPTDRSVATTTQQGTTSPILEPALPLVPIIATTSTSQASSTRIASTTQKIPVVRTVPILSVRATPLEDEPALKRREIQPVAIAANDDTRALQRAVALPTPPSFTAPAVPPEPQAASQEPVATSTQPLEDLRPIAPLVPATTTIATSTVLSTTTERLATTTPLTEPVGPINRPNTPATTTPQPDPVIVPKIEESLGSSTPNQ